jgi:hypothetical protein
MAIATAMSRKYSRICRAFLPASPHRSHSSINHHPTATDETPSSKIKTIHITFSYTSHQAIGTGWHCFHLCIQANLTNAESTIKISTIVAKLNFAAGLSSGSSGFVPLPEFLAVKSSSVVLLLTCGGGDEFCISESARSDESRLRLEGFGVVSEDGTGLGKEAAQT